MVFHEATALGDWATQYLLGNLMLSSCLLICSIEGLVEPFHGNTVRTAEPSALWGHSLGSFEFREFITSKQQNRFQISLMVTNIHQKLQVHIPITQKSHGALRQLDARKTELHVLPWNSVPDGKKSKPRSAHSQVEHAIMSTEQRGLFVCWNL